jgi:hypothetical protein
MIPAPVWLGLNEADWPDSPEAREALLARLDGIEPLELSPEDEAEIGMARESVRGASLRSVRQQMGLDS